MEATLYKPHEKTISEEQFNEETLKALNEKKELKPENEGVTQYPVLNFDERALRLLRTGVTETLKSSEIQISGGKAYEIVKRFFDILLSLTALIILAVPMLIVAGLIYMEDKGNPFFSQVRLTKEGKPFRMYKFRSMCMDAEKKFAEIQKGNKSDGLAFKDDNDPRITKIGKFIRKTSVDELPQLINVLRGDMSIIGPRPPLPREVVLYTPHHMDRLLIKGGLSCICQTEGRSDMPFEEWVDSDITYIQKRSLLFDVKLVVKTILAVLLRKGAK